MEDHTDFRNTLHKMLSEESRFSVIAFSKAEDIMKYLEHEIPHVIIMDINLPGISGLECTRQVKERYPSALILMNTVFEDDEKIFAALKAGASGYLLKRSPIEEIRFAIFDLVNGGSPMSPSIARKVVSSFSPPSSQNSSESLSRREHEILELLADGKRIKEIADQLFISINTVRTHIRNIYEKLRVQSRTEAINKAGKNFFRR
ncbi:MAG TPA: response regulator transcription factor [Chitinophagales bacterium]|nr:response regulator transcription factor [Chitinophagales bacterium]